MKHKDKVLLKAIAYLIAGMIGLWGIYNSATRLDLYIFSVISALGFFMSGEKYERVKYLKEDNQ